MRRDRDRAKDFAERHGVPRFYSSADALLADPEVNSVFVGTPPDAHAELTALAAAAGKHVICEKPIARTSAEARSMIEACDRAGVRLMICHYQRFNLRHRQMLEWIREGAIGRVVSARINFSSYSPGVDGGWRHDLARSGGGPLMDLGSHCLDLLLYCCGPIADSHSFVDAMLPGGTVEDTATLVLRFESGAHATVTTHWSARVPDGTTSNAIEIWGTDGSIVSFPLFSKDHSGTLLLHRPDETQDASLPPGRKVHEDLFEHFHEAVETGGPLLAPVEDAVRGLEVIERAYRTNGRGPGS
jgi:predicted dehydrogenase